MTVAKYIVLNKKEWSGDNFGSLRHQMFEEESKVTGKTPECFKTVGVDIVTEMHEERFSMDLMPGVVLHSTIDCYSPEESAIIDYKTYTNEYDLQTYKQSTKKSQLLTYALQLLNLGERVDKLIYLGERWNKERTELLGYDKLVISVTMIDIINNRDKLRQNAVRLMSAIAVLENEKQILT